MQSIKHFPNGGTCMTRAWKMYISSQRIMLFHFRGNYARDRERRCGAIAADGEQNEKPLEPFVYISQKPSIVQHWQQFYVNNWLYVWLIGFNLALFLNSFYLSSMTIFMGIFSSGWIGYQSIHNIPKAVLLKSIKFLEKDDPKLLVLEPVDRTQQADIVPVRNIICDHDPIFKTVMPFQAFWKDVLLNRQDLKCKNELRFTVVEYADINYADMIDEDHKIFKGNLSVTMHAPAIGGISSPKIFVIRDKHQVIERVRSLLEHYRSI
jgi:hypothetical protein